jgi:hypothetical protein
MLGIRSDAFFVGFVHVDIFSVILPDMLCDTQAIISEFRG